MHGLYICLDGLILTSSILSVAPSGSRFFLPSLFAGWPPFTDFCWCMAQTSSMDLHDGDSPYDHHLDLYNPNDDAKTANLFRNRDERKRLQGLVLSSKKAGTHTPFQPKNLRQRIELWMINRGAKYLFLVMWIILHLLVAIYGFIQFQVSDQFEFARRTFGLSYGQCSIIQDLMLYLTHLLQLSLAQRLLSFTSTSYSFFYQCAEIWYPIYGEPL
jgi:hypothetical protein